MSNQNLKYGRHFYGIFVAIKPQKEGSQYCNLIVDESYIDQYDIRRQRPMAFSISNKMLPDIEGLLRGMKGSYVSVCYGDESKIWTDPSTQELKHWVNYFVRSVEIVAKPSTKSSSKAA